MDTFYTLLEREIPRMRRYARALLRNHVDADDLVQDTLVRVLAKQHLWEPGTDLRAWLFTILHNQYVNGVRASLRQAKMVRIDRVIIAVGPTQEKGLELRDVLEAVGELPVGQQKVLQMHLEEISHARISLELGIPENTVRSRLSRARNKVCRACDRPRRKCNRPPR